MNTTKGTARKFSFFYSRFSGKAFGIVLGFYIVLNSNAIDLGSSWSGLFLEVNPIITLIRLLTMFMLIYILMLKIGENGRARWQALLWLIPIVGPIYVLYLAFSDNQ